MKLNFADHPQDLKSGCWIYSVVQRLLSENCCLSYTSHTKAAASLPVCFARLPQTFPHDFHPAEHGGNLQGMYKSLSFILWQYGKRSMLSTLKGVQVGDDFVNWWDLLHTLTHNDMKRMAFLRLRNLVENFWECKAKFSSNESLRPAIWSVSSPWLQILSRT